MEFWAKLWDGIVNFFTTNIWNIIFFFAVAILGLILIKIILNILKRVFKKTKLERTLWDFLLGLIKFTLLMVYAITLLAIVGVPITSLVAIITALTLAVGLAIQTSLSSLANGIILIAGRQFKEGEYIEIDGTGGTVERVTMLNTILKTPQGQIITIPHSKTAASVIVNYTKEGKRRMDIKLSVAYDSDVEKVKKVLFELMDQEDRILQSEPKAVVLSDYSASSIDFIFRAWTSTDVYWDALFDMREKILSKFLEHKIVIPYQTVDINIKK